ncbi:indeterminate-domain 9-like protein [Tanacetum coccineum]
MDVTNTNPNPNLSNSAKRKRNLAGNPDPDAEVIALSPTSLMATNRFVCEICSKGFQRDQNLQLHRRGHNLPWKLKQRNKNEIVRKKVYICPEVNCVHHDASRALGDLTGVKKHFSRKHGEKKWKCEKCSKKYAVQSDWKAHSKICGTREYKCDCGTIFSRKDSFITHRAFCDALTQENSRTGLFPVIQTTANLNFNSHLMMMNDGGRMINPRFPGMFGGCGGLEMNGLDGYGMKPRLPIWLHQHTDNPLENSTTNSSLLGSTSSNNNNSEILSPEMVQWLNRSHQTVENYTDMPQGLPLKEEVDNSEWRFQENISQWSTLPAGLPTATKSAGWPNPQMSATALLQKASQMESRRSTNSGGYGLMSTSELSGLSSLNQTGSNSVSEAENFSGGMMNGDGLMMMMMMDGLKQKTCGIDSNDGNLTRDFLGVEGNEQQELIKFNCSMND